MTTALSEYYELLEQVTKEPTEEEMKIEKAISALQDTDRPDGEASLIPFMLGLGMWEVMKKHSLFTHEEQSDLADRIYATKLYTEAESTKAFLAIRRMLIARDVPWNEVRITDVIYSAYLADDGTGDDPPFDAPPFTSFVTLSSEAQAYAEGERASEAAGFWDQSLKDVPGLD